MIAQDAAGSHAVAQVVVQEARAIWSALAAAPSGEAAERMVVEWSQRVGRRADAGCVSAITCSPIAECLRIGSSSRPSLLTQGEWFLRALTGKSRPC